MKTAEIVTCYHNCVSNNCDPRAHGGVTVEAHKGSKVRFENRNGRYVERSEWMPDNSKNED